MVVRKTGENAKRRTRGGNSLRSEVSQKLKWGKRGKSGESKKRDEECSEASCGLVDTA